MGPRPRILLLYLVLLAACGARPPRATVPCEAAPGRSSALGVEHRGDPNAVEPLAGFLIDAWDLHREHARPPCADCDDEGNPDADLEYAEGIVDAVASATRYAMLAGLDESPLVQAVRAINLAVGAGLFFQHHSEDFEAFQRATRDVRQEAFRGLEALDTLFQRAVDLHSRGNGDVARQVACLGARTNAFLTWNGLVEDLDHRAMMLGEMENHGQAAVGLTEDAVEAEALMDEVDEVSALTADAEAVTSILEDLDSPLDGLAASLEAIRQREHRGWDEALDSLEEVLGACGAS